MGLDYLAFKRIIELISSSIIDGKIVKINQLSNEEFLFVIRKDSQNYNLLVSTHPNMSYLNLVNEKPDGNRINTNLLMLFRKHLENGKISSFTQQNDDRVVLVEILNRDDYFRNTCHRLYIELIGRASNIILTDNDDKIIDSLKKIPLEYTNIRTILPGIKYTLPNKPEDETLPYDLQNEIEYRKISLEKLKEMINTSQDIYINEIDGKNKDFHFIPLMSVGGNISKYVFNEGLNKFYKDTLSFERHRQFTSDLDKLARNEIKKSEKKIKKLQEEQDNAKSSIIFKDYGDLLLTYMQGVKITTDTVVVHDEVNDIDVKIPYDTTKDLYQNANGYYKKYQKSKVAIVKIEEQINLCKENIEYFETIRFHLSVADVDSANQIKEELTELGYFRKYQKPTKGKKKEKVYRPLCFKYNNIVIYCGQNNLQNEYLTFKMANKNHMFFHVKDGPGAHVVVFSDNVDEKTKQIAALIASYYSSYRMSSTVPVNYTKIKDVKKIPGGKKGKVIINNYKTIYVDPDYDKIKDLLQ